ncbi:MAG: DUF1127 domain-containing protein [Alphaproteobacteria bacterium]|nr:DUF1127 domain-containing protein [Alphaproteobacteria bacterium]
MPGLLHWFDELNDRVRAASVRRQLARMDDRMLEDLGLARYQLDEVARAAIKNARR